MAAFLAPLIGAAGSLIGSGVSSLFNMNQAEKQRDQNMELAKYSYQKDLEMWNKSNEYNNPTNQMQRLKDAGLNPNMVYGSSSVVGNTSTQTPKYQRPEVPRASMKLELPNVMSMLDKYQDIQNKGVQHDNLSKQTELMEKESTIKSLNQLKIIAATEKSVSERKRIERLIDGQVKSLELGNLHEKLKMNITNKDWQNYSKYGIRPNDSLMWRGAAQAKDGITDWFKKFLKSKSNANLHGLSLPKRD